MPHDDLTIVYEDRSLLLCVKPVGVLSEDSENGASMPHLLRQHYAAAHQPDYIATVHRLDKVTGGLMLFSRQRAVTGRLIAAVAEHRVEKEYLAVLRGHPPEKEGELIDLLFRDAAKNKSYVVKRIRKGVREAKLSYHTLAETDKLTLVRVRLFTGRTHQIRVHMAYIGHPILGDTVYGNKKPVPGLQGQCLHAVGLKFIHPRTGELVELTCGLPEEFEKQLKKYRNMA